MALAGTRTKLLLMLRLECLIVEIDGSSEHHDVFPRAQSGMTKFAHVRGYDGLTFRDARESDRYHNRFAIWGRFYQPRIFR